MASSSRTMLLAAVGAVFAALLGAGPAAGAGQDSGTETAGDEAAATWVPRQVIVRFEPGAGPSDRAEARREAGTVPAEALGLPGLQLLRIRDGESVPETVSELEAAGAVRYAEPNLTYAPAAMPDDPLADQLWGLENTAQGIGGFNGPLLDADIDAAAAWDVESGDEATILAVLDTGVDVHHPDLEPQLWQNPGEVGGEHGVDDDGNGRVDDTSGWDFLNTDSNDDTPDSEDADPSDLHGHGTHVAGTALARGGNAKGITGVAQRGSLMVLRVCAAYDGSCPLADQIEAINYAAAEGAKVLNGSIAGDGVSQAVRDTLNAHPEMLFVFAAGNDAKDVDAEPQGPCQADQVGSGAYTAGNVICVTATDQADRLAGFSNFGASGVDLAAPGTQIMSSSARRVMFSDDFETDELTTRWTASAGSSWERTDEAPLETFGASDSPGGHYAPNTAATLTSEAIPMQPGYSSCRLNYYRSTVLGAGDRFDIEVLLNGLVKESISFAGPQASERRTFISLNPAFDAGGTVRIRFRVTADGSSQADGIHMDDVSLVCSGPPSDGAYEFRQGTSMAAPHVSGAAALIFSRDPDATPAQVKALLLGTTDPLATLAGKTVTGGRLNAGRALASTPADTMITGGTAAEGETIATRRAGFTYASTEADPAYQCSLDGAPFGACSAETPLLANGTHTFRVRTVDPRGNIEGTPALRTFTVDSPANGMQVDSGPGEGAQTADRTPSFTFSSTAADAAFLCAVEPGAVRGSDPLAPCTSAAGHTTSPLADGTWTLWVEARDPDGNVVGDASRTFHVDATPPDTALTGRPPAVGGPNPAFVFSSPEQGAGFQCRLDAEPSGAWAPCSSPTTFNGLPDGDHVFAVRALDSLGNADTSPATASFRVDTVAPAVEITQGPAGLTNDTTPTFSFGPEAGSTVACSLDRGTAAFSACASAAQHTPPAPLRDGAWVFRVRATDAAGNTHVATRALTVDATAPQTTIQRRPRRATKIRTSRRRVTFSFSATEAASFLCAVDSGPMRPCARRISRTLRAGRHRIRVVAVDRAANRDATPAVYRFRLQRAG